MADLVVLYESAIGYALFDVRETEDIGIEADSVQVSVQAAIAIAPTLPCCAFSSQCADA